MVDETQKLVPNPDTKEIEYVWLELEKLKSINLYPIGIAVQILDNITDTAHFIYKE